jgi:hypothetical protein
MIAFISSTEPAKDWCRSGIVPQNKMSRGACVASISPTKSAPDACRLGRWIALPNDLLLLSREE